MTLKKSIALLLTAVILASACGVWLGFYLNETVTATETASEGHLSIVQIAQNTLDTVVEITTETTVTDRRMRQYIYEGAGSGVVISSDGKIVTNNHVIEGAGKITVRLSNGEEYAATLLGRDAASDLAVLKINKNDLKYAVFGDSDTLQVGETAVAIGNPLGELGGTVTEGIISAKERSIDIDGQVMTLLQTTAAINSGNSGGGLFNDRGQLIGIVNAKFADVGIEGLGFAIPINLAAPIIKELEEQGYVGGRPTLGIRVSLGESSYLSYYFHVGRTGLFVTDVFDDRCPLKEWDRIVSVNGETVDTFEELSAILQSAEIGEKLTVKIIRNYAFETLEVPVIEQRW